MRRIRDAAKERDREDEISRVLLRDLRELTMVFLDHPAVDRIDAKR
ncbi:hypothetical protein [Burkholderia pyrrocinia]|nr:hypothetical protein [Burkholderia pyrrocinia]